MKHLPSTIVAALIGAGCLMTSPLVTTAQRVKSTEPIAPAAVRPTTAELFSAVAKAEFFEQQVQPILETNCLRCHSDKASGGLRLNSREAILKGGDSGPAVDLAKPETSRLVQAINYRTDLQMPPSGKLPRAQIDTLTKWVSLGLPWSSTKGSAPAVHHRPPPVNAETMKFWSFQTVKRPAVPAVKVKGWVRNPIDNFVLSKLEANGLKPAPPASRTALLRRATYDLTGLPPTPEQVRDFLSDQSPQAYEKVVDRLLASPQYGERWGRHWLDLVRYAESNSFERDDPKPFAWRYRDYVVRSLNADKPYDQFLREQLAGDELDTVTPDTIIATGYYRLGQWDDEPSDPDQARYDELDDIVATTGQVTLGLTVNCARCHDHKLDPIPQKDYYRLLAFFQGVRPYGVRSAESVAQNSLRPIASAEEQRRFEKERADYLIKFTRLDAQLAEIVTVGTADFTPVEKDDFKAAQNRVPLLKKRVPARLSEETLQKYIQLAQQRDDLVKAPPKGLEQALCVTEGGRVPETTHVLMRGNPHVPGDAVEPGFPSVLAPPAPAMPSLPPDKQSSGRRLALANWLASGDNPLTARVMANRIWQHHFGRGIVRSSSNFGFLGTPPTHPEMLDWLASEFVRDGWHLKPLHRLIMLSSAYRMSSQAEPKALAKDPENDLLWRFDMRRLDAEEVRDSVLAMNDSLNLQGGGPSIYPVIPKEVLAGQSRPGNGWGKSTPEEAARRSIYIHVKRSLAVPLLASFDAADTDFTCPVRFSTTQPTQALSLMNSDFIYEQAGLFAQYLRKNAGANPAAQARLGLWRVLQREPTAVEVARGVKLMTRLQAQHHASEVEALQYYCIVLLNLNEFVYLS